MASTMASKLASKLASTMASKETSQQPCEDVYPWYNIRDEETPRGYMLLKILKDSPEGREYTGLESHEERLEYMRNHYHEKRQSVRPDTAFYEDRVEGKRWLIKMGSPEYERLMRLKQEDGSSWPKGTQEYEQMIQYYKEHGGVEECTPTSVCQVPKVTKPQ